MAISNTSFFDQFSPFIECVDVVKNNATDIGKITFKVKGDPITVIKWCRRNFGDRGDGWDFSGTGKKVEVTIWSSKLQVMWELWQE
jgi:hypothetical protein